VSNSHNIYAAFEAIDRGIHHQRARLRNAEDRAQVLEAENARLREALTNIADNSRDFTAKVVARAALSAGGGDG